MNLSLRCESLSLRSLALSLRSLALSLRSPPFYISVTWAAVRWQLLRRLVVASTILRYPASEAVAGQQAVQCGRRSTSCTATQMMAAQPVAMVDLATNMRNGVVISHRGHWKI